MMIWTNGMISWNMAKNIILHELPQKESLQNLKHLYNVLKVPLSQRYLVNPKVPSVTEDLYEYQIALIVLMSVYFWGVCGV